jgi:hypothetical protein
VTGRFISRKAMQLICAGGGGAISFFGDAPLAGAPSLPGGAKGTNGKPFRTPRFKLRRVAHNAARRASLGAPLTGLPPVDLCFRTLSPVSVSPAHPTLPVSTLPSLTSTFLHFTQRKLGAAKHA